MRIEPPLPTGRDHGSIPTISKTGATTGVKKGGRSQHHSPRTVGKVGSHQSIIHAWRASGQLTGPEERLWAHSCYKNRSRVVTELN